jgi:rod shape-determining protein MreC
MKTLINRKTIAITSIAILLAIITTVSINVFDNTGPVTGLANVVSGPLRSLASFVASPFERIYDSIYRYSDLMEDHERNLKELTEFRRDYREVIELREENERLRALLGFRDRYSGYDYEPANVVRQSGSNWSSSFIIDRGSANSRIVRGNAVATEYGVLIGQVTDVGATSSIFVSVLDTTFSAGALVGDSGARVTVKGDYTHMNSGLLLLDYIDDDLIILPGDTVETSGIGSVFPVGLIIGEVVSVYRHSTGVGRYATVRPTREIATIQHVFIITDFDVSD